MHVLIIPGEELNAENTFSSIFELQQGHALAKRGLQVGFISVQMDGAISSMLKRNWWKPRFIFNQVVSRKKVKLHLINGLNIIESQGVYLYPKLKFLLYRDIVNAGLAAFKEYVKLYGKPDIIHAHSRFLTSGLIARKITGRYKIPFIITDHSSFFARGLVSRYEYSLVQKVINSSKNWLVVSPQLGDLIKAKIQGLNKNYKYVPNILDPIFEGSYSKSSQFEGSFVFLNLGSLTEIKNQKLLIKAFASKFKDDLNFLLKIGGKGGLETDLKSLVKELEVDRQVIFLGHLNRDEVISEMHACSVFVLSSNYETFGVVIIEALACGKPIISTSCGGTPNIVNEKNGVLVKVNDEMALSEAMTRIHANYYSYNSKKIRENCIANFGSESVSNELISVYKNILE